MLVGHSCMCHQTRAHAKGRGVPAQANLEGCHHLSIPLAGTGPHLRRTETVLVSIFLPGSRIHWGRLLAAGFLKQPEHRGLFAQRWAPTTSNSIRRVFAFPVVPCVLMNECSLVRDGYLEETHKWWAQARWGVGEGRTKSSVGRKLMVSGR